MKTLASVALAVVVAGSGIAFAGPACCGAGKEAKEEKAGCAVKAECGHKAACGAAKQACADKGASVKSQTSCPVMGGPVNKSIHADHDGKRVYFCCGKCVDAFNQDPAKYIQKLEAEGVTLDPVPAE